MIVNFSEEKTEQEIFQADAILVLYDVTRSETVTRLHSFWLPKINRLARKTPVIIVGNKIDLENEENENQERHKIQKIMKPLIKDFKVISIYI